MSSNEIPTIRIDRDSVDARLLFAMSEDAAAPSTRTQLRRAAGISNGHAKTNLSALRKRGVIAHVGRNQYVRLVGEVEDAADA